MMIQQSAPTPLSSGQLRQFDREGYLVVENVFTADDLQPVIDEITAVIDERARALVACGALSRDYREEPFETRLARINGETDKLAGSIWDGGLHGPGMFNLIRHRRLLDIAEQMCGPELIASSVYRLRPKVPGHRMGPVPWHQDSAYFEPYCDKSLVLTVWLPLVDATEANGCLWMLPRVHRGEVITHHTRPGKPYLAILDHDLPIDADHQPVCAPVKKGGVVLFTNRTPHTSFENNTDGVRWAMDLRYQSAKLPTNAKITRLPGETVGSPSAGIPGSCYPPEADFLVRSRSRPSEVVTDPAVFARLRETHLATRTSRNWQPATTA